MKQNAVIRTTVFLVTLAVASSAWAAFSATEAYLPSVGIGPGAGSSYWYTTVWVHNPGSEPANVRFEFLERDRSNVSPAFVFNETVQPGDTRRYDNAMDTIFGITDRRFGAIRVVSSDKVVVNGRIYSKVQNGQEADSVGQFFAAVPASFAIGAGEKTTVLGVYQTNPQESSEYRYNFGFVEVAGASCLVEMEAYDAGGDLVRTKNYTLQAYEPKQFNIRDLVSDVNSTNLRLQAKVMDGSGKVVVFGSGLANRSNDPSTFEMTFADSLLAGGGGGGGSFTLPYSGSVSSGSTAFAVTNSGNGAALEGETTGTGPAVLGSSSSGAGVKGISTSNAGVYGESGALAVRGLSTLGSGRAYGVYGSATSNQGIGVYGEATEASSLSEDSYGGYFVANGWGDVGVFGISKWSAGGGVGGHFASAAQYGYGVYGFATHTTGENTGVYGETMSSSGFGVYGKNTLTGGVGVKGSGGAVGVQGVTSGGMGGVWGDHTSSHNVGVLGSLHFGVEGYANSSVTNDSGVYGVSHYGATNGVFGETKSDAGGAAGVFGVHNSTSGAGSGVWGRTFARLGYGGKFENRAEGGTAIIASSRATSEYPGAAIIAASTIDAGGATVDYKFLVDVQGNVLAKGQFIAGWGADLAERVDASEELGAGDLVEIDTDNPGSFRLTRRPFSTLVAGVVSTRPGMLLNHQPRDQMGSASGDERPQLALAGQVPVRASTENGTILVGDLLVASSTPGHVMRAGVNPPAGAVVGKALQPLTEGTGLVMMLVTLQ